jgi:hypothetical protein
MHERVEAAREEINEKQAAIEADAADTIDDLRDHAADAKDDAVDLIMERFKERV